MSKMKRLLILAAVFLLLLNASYAAAFSVKVTPIKDKIVVDEVAEFNISIENNLDTEQEFTIKKAGYPFWDMYTKPLQNPITLVVPARSASSITLFVDPLHITSEDTYTLDMGVVLGMTGQEQKVPVTVGIKSIEPLISGYIPTVLASISILPQKIDPRESAMIRITLNNQNVINYTNLTLKIEGSLISEELYTPLGPNEDKTIEVAKKFDAMTPPQQGKAVFMVFKDKRVIVNPIEKEFEINEYAIREEIPSEQSFLKIKKGIKFISNNPDYKGVIKVGVTSLKNLILTTYPRAETAEENGRQYLVWQVELDDNRTMTAYTVENYRPIVIIIVLIIIAIAIYFVFRSPIVVRKSVAGVSMSEGGISEAKVVIRIHNRSAKQLTSIEVIDNVPHIAHVEKEISIGSMQPHAVLMHPKKGVVIKWGIEALEPGDERVLSYKMKSRLAILGEFNLPAANARCKIGDKVVLTNSNRVTVGV